MKNQFGARDLSNSKPNLSTLEHAEFIDDIEVDMPLNTEITYANLIKGVYLK